MLSKLQYEPNPTHEDISLKLCRILDRIGVTEKVRTVYRNNVTAMEQLTTLMSVNTCINSISKESFSVYYFGSFCEGTTTPGLHSDIDCVKINEDFPVVEDLINAADTECLIMLRDRHTPSGYIKLQLSKTMQHHRLHGLYVRAQNVKTGHYFITNEKTDSLSEDANTLLNKNTTSQRHGPAETLCEPIKRNGVVVHDFDYIRAFRSNSWPSFATEWLERKRHHGWPTSEMISKFEKLGCLCVPVGHPNSPEKRLEWRLSFSLQERQLMNSLNDVQYKCYVLLKLVKNDLITARIGKSLTSYHCKTSLFYTIENNCADMWTQENFIHCFLQCIKLLYSWCEIGFFPNYFIPQGNMFDGKMGKKLRVQLKYVLQEIKLNSFQCLQKITCDNLGKILQLSYTKSNKDFISQIETNNDIALGKSMFLMYSFCESTVVSCKNLILNSIMQTNSFSGIAGHFHYLDLINEYESTQKLECAQSVIPYIHTSLASHLAAIAICCEDTTLRDWYICASAIHFVLGMNSDVLSSRLKYATVLYKMGHYDSCESVLSKLEAKLSDTDVFRVCPGKNEKKPLKRFLNLFKLKKEEVLDTTLEEFFHKYVSTCVIFLLTEMAVTPHALRYELFRSADLPKGLRESECLYFTDDYWYDWAVVDAKVYYYFLKFLLNENDKEPLHQVIKLLDDNCHAGTLLKITGYMHERFGEECMAALAYIFSSYFFQNLLLPAHTRSVDKRKTPNTHVHDSVQWRMAVLMWKLWSKSKC